MGSRGRTLWDDEEGNLQHQLPLHRRRQERALEVGMVAGDQEGLGLKAGQGKEKSDRPKKAPQSPKRCQKRGRRARRSIVGLLGLLVTYLPATPANYCH